MDPREESFEEDLGSLLGRLAELAPPPPDAAGVGMALRRRGRKRKALGGVAAVVVVGVIVTAWALHGTGSAAPLPPVIQAAAGPEQPVQPRPGGNEMPTLSFLSVAMPTFETGQEFKFETGPVSIPATVTSEGPRLAVTYRVPSVSMPKL